MKVVITGANSAVGQAIFRCVRKGGASPDTFIAAVRSSRAEEQLRSQIGDLSGMVRISYDDPATLDAAFRGAGSVVHLAGILIEQPHTTYEDANVGSTRSVVEGAMRNKVEKLTLVSAIGADENSRNRYYRTKGQAEALVRESGLSYTILRVPILLGSATAGAAALKHQLEVGRASLINGGLHQQQPLHVDDLARAAMVVATRLSVARDTTLELVGPARFRSGSWLSGALANWGAQFEFVQFRSSLYLWLSRFGNALPAEVSREMRSTLLRQIPAWPFNLRRANSESNLRGSTK